MVDLLGCVPSTVGNENSSNPYENVADHFVIDGEQSNKVMQLSDVTEVGSEEMSLDYDLSDHSCLQEDEIPRVEIRFAQLQMAHEFYVTYVKKVEFATKIRTTTCDKITKKPVNQAIHCNRNGFRGSRVKVPTRKNMILAPGCKARIYVTFDKDIQEWVLFKVELRYSHPCSVRKVVHFHEYRELTMHAKCVIEDNDEAEIRPNKIFLALANEAGGLSNLGFSEKDLRNYIIARLRSSNVNADVREMMNYFMRMKDINLNFFYAVKLDEGCKFRSVVWVDARHGLPFMLFVSVNHHGKSTLLDCALLGNEEITSYEWVFSQWVKYMGTAPQRIITDQCRSIFCAIRNAIPDTRHWWYIWHITKKLSHKLGGYHRYRELYDDLNDIVWNSQTKESFEDNWSEFIDEYNLHNNTWLSVFHSYKLYKVPTYYILPRLSKNIKCKHTYVKSSHGVSRSDESHVAFRKLCAHFYNVAQEFVGDDDVTALLHTALKKMAKLATHRAKKRSESMAETHTSIDSQSSNVVGVVDIQDPSKVTTKGRSKSKRLGVALEKSLKKYARKKNKNVSLLHVVRLKASQDINFGAVVGRNDPQ
ncbi:protein FAR1-RELATED SEQUENCE 5-like [Arachis stenosperma]|uniref:protein FAR1-RELATED SEQUENCE 5-like n=1 Tax=Arachis stenosperma TaxID=217475 RepID=UPI0025ACB8F1|nr:protein FAR1-RELATED SEQUENCE 5-like [Arachis stenosperma]